MVGFLPLIENIGCGRGIPDISYTKRRIKIKPDNALIVHVDGLIDEIHGIRRLVWQLHRGLVAILEIEGRYIFLSQDIVELGVILDVRLQLRVSDDCRVVVDVARTAMQFSI